MALKDYYELSAMLRMQLPILLSFAVLRCLIGNVVLFWSRRLIPEKLQEVTKPIATATTNLLSVLQFGTLAVALFYSAFFHSEWSNKRYPSNSDELLVCTEFAHTRVHGLSSAIGLLAMFTSSDGFTLGLALCIFKAVADGSVMVLVICALTCGASRGLHDTRPVAFFTVLFTCTMAYTKMCYSDKPAANLTDGASLTAAFAGLLLIYRMFMAGTMRTWRGFKRGCASVMGLGRRLVRRATAGHND